MLLNNYAVTGVREQRMTICVQAPSEEEAIAEALRGMRQISTGDDENILINTGHFDVEWVDDQGSALD